MSAELHRFFHPDLVHLRPTCVRFRKADREIPPRPSNRIRARANRLPVTDEPERAGHLLSVSREPSRVVAASLGASWLETPCGTLTGASEASQRRKTVCWRCGNRRTGENRRPARFVTQLLRDRHHRKNAGQVERGSPLPGHRVHNVHKHRSRPAGV